jgi:BolA protein
MSDAATASVATQITARLTAALAPTRLEVVNDSHHHAGHAGDNGTGESHFTVIIEAPAFAGLSRVARQRMVNKALADLLETRIHALVIRASAPGD